MFHPHHPFRKRKIIISAYNWIEDHLKYTCNDNNEFVYLKDLYEYYKNCNNNILNTDIISLEKFIHLVIGKRGDEYCSGFRNHLYIKYVTFEKCILCQRKSKKDIIECKDNNDDDNNNNCEKYCILF